MVRRALFALLPLALASLVLASLMAACTSIVGLPDLPVPEDGGHLRRHQ